MMISGVHHVSINVDDLEATRAFYVDTLGFELLPRPDLGIAGAWLGMADGRQLHLIEGTVPPGLGQHFALHVADIDAAIAELRTGGLEVSDPSAFPDGARQAFLSDPSGNLVELNQPA
ncbi:MAG: VOC family protein [Acidimicrobiia bacterium]|nr:VOC family protein [Acidimicrobiia bacterium]